MLRDFHMGAGGPGSVQRVLDELPLAQAFALMAWHTENNPWASVRRASDGYVAQEAWQVMQSRKLKAES